MLSSPLTTSFCKDLRGVFEGLKLQSIAAGIEKKHSGLFAHFPFKANVRLNHKLNAMPLELLGQAVPVLPLRHRPEMPDGYIFAIYGVDLRLRQLLRFDVCAELMPEEIEVDPLVGRAACFAARQVAKECFGTGNVFHRKGQMERGGHNQWSVVSKQ